MGESRASRYVCLIGQYTRVDDISGFPTANQKISFRFVYQGFFVSTTTRFPLQTNCISSLFQVPQRSFAGVWCRQRVVAMETNDQKPASDRRSATASPSPAPTQQPRPPQNTPTDNDLAHALLSLSLPSETSTPVIDRPRSSLAGSYPETPAPLRQIPLSQIPSDPFHTPIRHLEPSQPLQYPNLADFESS